MAFGFGVQQAVLLVQTGTSFTGAPATISRFAFGGGAAWDVSARFWPWASSRLETGRQHELAGGVYGDFAMKFTANPKQKNWELVLFFLMCSGKTW